MKHLKLYESYNIDPNHPGFFETYEETKNWLDQMGIENYTINDDLSVDVKGDVVISEKNLKYIPVQFEHVTGYFDVTVNKLTSLTGAPSYVGEGFYCGINYLVSTDHFYLRKVGSQGYHDYDNFIIFSPSDQDNPGYREDDNNFLNIMEKFLRKLYNPNDIVSDEDKLRILNALKLYEPDFYKELMRYDIEDWLSRFLKSEKHKDIMDL